MLSAQLPQIVSSTRSPSWVLPYPHSNRNRDSATPAQSSLPQILQRSWIKFPFRSGIELTSYLAVICPLTARRRLDLIRAALCLSMREKPYRACRTLDREKRRAHPNMSFLMPTVYAPNGFYNYSVTPENSEVKLFFCRTVAAQQNEIVNNL